MDYYLGIWIALGILLIAAIVSTVVNHHRKTKSNKKVCPSCRGMGFTPTYTSRPIPSCKKCGGTGYIPKS